MAASGPPPPPGGAGMGGMGFGAQFSIGVGGNATAQFAAISGAMNTVTNAANQVAQAASQAASSLSQISANLGPINAVKDAAGRTAMAVSDAAQQMDLLLHATTELEHLGHQMMGFGEMILHGVAHPFAEAIKEAGELEVQSIALRSAFRDLNNEAFGELQKRIQAISVSSPFPMKQINEIVTALKNVGNVDLSKTFDGAGKRMKETGIAFMTDLAAGTGRSLEDVLFATRIMLSETGERAFLSFKHRLHMGGSEAMKAVLQQAGESFDFSTPQKRLETLFKFISIKFGGLSQQLTESAEGMVQVIKDTVRVGVFNAIQTSFERYKGMLHQIKDFLDSIFNSETEKGKRFQEVFTGVLTTIGDVFEKIAMTGLKIARVITDWMSENPELAKFLTKMVMLAGVFTVVAGAAVLAIGIIGKFVAIMAGLAGGMMLGGRLLMSFAIGLRAVSFAAIALIGIPYLLYQAFVHNFGGIAYNVERVLLFFEALFELISSNHGTVGRISEDMYNKLAKIPGFFGPSLLGDVIGFFKLFTRAHIAIEGFVQGFKDAFNEIIVIAEPVFKKMFGWLGDLANWLGLKMVKAGDTAVDKWTKWGQTLGASVAIFLTVMTVIRSISLALSGLNLVVRLISGAWAVFTALLEINPITLIALAIAVVIGALYLWLGADEETRKTIQEGWGRLVSYIMDKLQELTGWDGFATLKRALIHPIDTAKEAWAQFEQKIQEFDLDAFKTKMNNAMLTAMKAIEGWVDRVFTPENIAHFMESMADLARRSAPVIAEAYRIVLTAETFVMGLAFAIASALAGALRLALEKVLPDKNSFTGMLLRTTTPIGLVEGGLALGQAGFAAASTASTEAAKGMVSPPEPPKSPMATYVGPPTAPVVPFNPLAGPPVLPGPMPTPMTTGAILPPMPMAGGAGAGVGVHEFMGPPSPSTTVMTPIVQPEGALKTSPPAPTPISVPTQEGPATSTAVSNQASGQIKIEVKHAPQTIQVLLDGHHIYQQLIKHDDQEFVRGFGSNEAFAP